MGKLIGGGIVMKVISGGQTGADCAGLDAAHACGLETGGWAPSNYWTERGPDPSLKALGLRAGGSLNDRTARNVLDADATVVFQVRPSPGSDLTLRLALKSGRPVRVYNPWDPKAEAALRDFLETVHPRILNVAGHRESKAPGIYQRVYELLISVLNGSRREAPDA